MSDKNSEKKYSLTVAGIGPGAGGALSGEVKKAIEECDVAVGYPVYLDLLRGEFPQKEYLSTPMRREEERCRMAYEKAREGKRVVLICGGDPGVYSLAGLMLALNPDYPDCEIKILPGITAATAGAALLGAPLGHDFAVISLSESLTLWETIEKRLLAAAEADFVICLYNPASKNRPDGLKKACEVLLTVLEPERVCGVTRLIGREGEECMTLSLDELKDYPADMSTTVFVGNSKTCVTDGKMVTPRGYKMENRV